MRKSLFIAMLAGCVAPAVSFAGGGLTPILAPGDSIISIDLDPFGSFSASPEGEEAFLAADLDENSKYLNFGTTNTGFIVTPLFPNTILRSLVFTTANDAVERDPASWKVYGTNDAIASVDHGTGSAENWSLIAEGDLALPDDRLMTADPISFPNSTPYSSYRVLIPTVKDPAAANSMQIAELRGFESATPNISQFGIWEDLDPFVPFQLPVPTGRYPAGEGPGNLLDFNTPTGTSGSASPDGEGPELVVDGTATKYLNFGEENSGFIVTPSVGPTTVQSFKFFTANDAEERDPTSYQLFGTNDPITSANHSLGNEENWALISEGPLAFPADRNIITDVTSFSNSTAYTSYRMIFPTVKDAGAANSMQIGEVFFFEDMVGAGVADILQPTDPVLAIDTDEFTGANTKFINQGGANGGFIVTPAAGASTIEQFQVVTANDFSGRDPATWELYGTNDSITSEDTGQGGEENWVLIDSGTFSDAEVPVTRLATGQVVTVANSTEYESYRMVFPTVRNPDEEGAGGLLQIASVQFYGDVTVPVGTNGADFLAIQRTNPAGIAAWEAAFGANLAAAAVGSVPEPGALVFVLSGLAATLVRRNRRTV